MVNRGEIWWASLDQPTASEPGYKRPVLVIQANDFNRSRIDTVIVVPLTSNLRLAEAPGNVIIAKIDAGLSKDSVANVSQIITIDKEVLTEQIGRVKSHVLSQVEDGVRLVLGL